MSYFADEDNKRRAEELRSELEFENAGGADGPGGMDADLLKGMTFVITGSLEHFENRKQLQELIADLGGKASGSVSSKTSFLINNDTQSGSSKNKKAKELGVPIISEEEFLERFGIEV